MTPVWWGLGAAVVALFLYGHGRQARAARVAALREAWGTDTNRPRNVRAIAAYHLALVAADSPGRSIDDRTWTDTSPPSRPSSRA
jgi:hypothetical protein